MIKQEQQKVEDLFDVYLFNDDKNTEIYVVQILTTVIDLAPKIAANILFDVNKKGRALIDTCSKDEAVIKRNKLIAFGLKSEICKVD